MAYNSSQSMSITSSETIKEDFYRAITTIKIEMEVYRAHERDDLEAHIEAPVKPQMEAPMAIMEARMHKI